MFSILSPRNILRVYWHNYYILLNIVHGSYVWLIDQVSIGSTDYVAIFNHYIYYKTYIIVIIQNVIVF